MGNSETRRRAASDRQRRIRTKLAGLAPPAQGSPRFVADVMLGRLAKWLRIAGFDVLYSNRFSDDALIEISLREDRVLLSRDTRLLIRKPVQKFIYLETQEIQSQIRQVFASMHIRELDSLLTRCLECNDILIDATREAVRTSVPPFVYTTQSRFKSCPKCGKIFWAGTHRNSVVRTLNTLLAETAGQRTEGIPGRST